MKPYRTLFVGELVQQSSFSVGGNQPTKAVDSPLCRNGENRLTLRGSSIAGALISTASKIVGNVARSISNKFYTDSPSQESVWRFFNSHPYGDPLPELRQGVGLLQATGAAAEGVLFDLETLPRETKWWFCLEVNTTDEEEGVFAERLAAAALQEWERGRCWIGRDVARGLGWMKFAESSLKAYRLTTDHLYDWPNSHNNKGWEYLGENIAELEKLEGRGVKPISSDQFAQEIGILPAERCNPWFYLQIKCHIHVGERKDGWGIDSLSLGGHAANNAIAEWNDKHYLAPVGRNPDDIRNTFNPDFSILFTQSGDKKKDPRGGSSLVPMIPGSSIRGTMRHALSRLLRKSGDNRGLIKDPNDPSQRGSSIENDPVEQLFGGMSRSASLLVRDAYLSKDEWGAAWIQHHAEDEFSAGVFESSKFDRVALINSDFEFEMVIEGEQEETVKEWAQLLEPVLKLGEKSHLPLGGGQWRGSGWPSWRVTNRCLSKAGSNVDLLNQ